MVADEEAFQQIFDNLIDNAIKYTPEQEAGSTSAAPSTRCVGDSVEIAVSRLGDRHPARRPPADLRAVLPRRQGPESRVGRDRARPGNRQARRRVARRPGHRGQPPRRGDPLSRPPPPPRRTQSRKRRLMIWRSRSQSEGQQNTKPFQRTTCEFPPLDMQADSPCIARDESRPRDAEKYPTFTKFTRRDGKLLGQRALIPASSRDDPARVSPHRPPRSP